MLRAGVHVGMGTDATRVASYNPWVGLWWLVTGKTLAGTRMRAPENNVDRLTALRGVVTRRTVRRIPSFRRNRAPLLIPRAAEGGRLAGQCR
jgi:hypothetical protein